MPTTTVRLVPFLVFFTALSCAQSKQSTHQPKQSSPENTVPVTMAMPLTAEQAAALEGIRGGIRAGRRGETTEGVRSASETEDDLVADVYVNEELVADGIRGGIRAGVRGGIRAAEYSGIRAAEAGGIRGMMPRNSVAPDFTSGDGSAGSSGVKPDATGDERNSVRGEPSRTTNNGSRFPIPDSRRQAPEALSLAFELTFHLPIKHAGQPTVRTRLRSASKPEVAYLEVKTTVKISVQQSAVSGQPGTSSPSTGEGSGGGAPDGVTGDGRRPTVDVVIEDTPIALNQVDLPDLDGDGVSTLIEVAAMAAEKGLDEAMSMASDNGRRPTADEAQRAFVELAKTLNTTLKDQGIKTEITLQEIDLVPPETEVKSEGLSVKGGDPVVFTLSCNEAVCSFHCALDGAAFSSCTSPFTLYPSPAAGDHILRAVAADALGNRDPSPATVTFTVLPPTPVCAPSTEICDGKDNDCDGTIDEDWVGAPFTGASSDAGIKPAATLLECNTGLSGVCSEGTQICSNGTLACAPRLAPGAEICDAKDNDCNGKVDDALPSASCVTGLKGVCSAGTTQCSGGSSVCSQTTASAAETCDGADNDCDGSTDEDFSSLGQACTSGPGECGRSGTNVCKTDGTGVTCTATAGTASTEICDSKDNDCDGSTDEDGVCVTPDTTPPTFSGLSSASPISTSQIDLFWSAATDNVSASSTIVYDICRSITSGTCQTSFTTTYTTAAGATSYSVTSLASSVTYYFVARAKDQIGNTDTNTIQKSATTPAPPPSTVTTIETGAEHTCAVLPDGSARCWGMNDLGQLGDGTTTNRLTPTAVSSLTGVVSIGTSGPNSLNRHTCALLVDGTVKCWGRGADGELGDGTSLGKTTPVQVSTLTSAVQIAVGSDHTCALISDGTLRCWGENVDGELGDGTGTRRYTPVAVSTLSGVVHVSAGDYYTCAVVSDGSARCWGWNMYGKLGDGTSTSRNTPIVVTSLTNAVAISQGEIHACALIADGTVRCWGYGVWGRLGDGTSANKSTPVAVSTLTSAVALSVGWDFACALLAGGAVHCWGDGGEGRLGDGTQSNKLTPIAVSSLSNAVQISTSGYGHSCAVISDGTAKCWGRNATGQLGDGTTAFKTTPVAVSNLPAVIGVVSRQPHEIASPGTPHPARGFREGLTNHLGSHTCALLSNGTAKCWGANGSGQLGNGTTANKSTPVAVSTLTNVVAMAGGVYHTCSLLSDGSVKCWGWNSSGQLGDGTSANKSTPVTVSTLTNAIAVAGGQDHSCSLLSDGSVKCWGGNPKGQLGDGTTAQKTTPVAVTNLSSSVAIAGGLYHTCSLLSDGSVRCWGGNNYGGLGDGTVTNKSTPIAVSSLTNAVAVAGGVYHTCSLISDGTIKCWGYNYYGELGDGTTADKSTPVAVSLLTNGVAVAGGDSDTCSLISDGTIKCWGFNGNGRLGDGTTADRPTPTAVSSLSGAVAIAVGYSHTCALLSDGTVKCWGWNTSGQIGDGTTTDRLTPVAVTSLP